MDFFLIFAENYQDMRRGNLTDNQIINGFKMGNSYIIQNYFYEYCKAGYYVFDKHYDLSHKENLDCISLTHQYAIYLLEHNWQPLENRSEGVSLRTWVIGGFRYIVLDALKWYRKEYGSISFEDYLQSFDITSDLRLRFRQTVMDMCDTCQMDRTDRVIALMMFERGFKSKDIAVQLGMSPSAVSQRYKLLKEKTIIPYFRQHFDMELDMPEVIDKEMVVDKMSSMAKESISLQISESFEDSMPITYENRYKEMKKKRVTPEFITSLAPNEIFVFGSNLRGMHGGGAAYVAVRKFGAVMGQGVGLQGQSYAIPTMQGGVETIRPYVDDFIDFARKNTNLTFLVTRIGCGIAGFRDEEIAPLFAAAHDLDNVVLPEGW